VRIQAIEAESEIRATLHGCRELADRALGHWLARKSVGLPQSLVRAVSYSLLAPGKRLRPTLVMLACEAAGGQRDLALPAAVAVEMIHTYSLIHDDLPAMDDDDLRRGLPTCHKKFGEALAILAGDELLTLAFEVLAEGYPPAIAAVSVGELARGAGGSGMVGGQVLDLAAEGRIPGEARPTTAADLEAIHRRKTGELFVASLRLGAHAAGAEPNGKVLNALDAYGRKFGLMFQVHDDLLDVESDSDTAGKRVGKDAARGKLTYPGLLGIDESRRLARQLCDEAVTSVAGLGDAGKPLIDLARYVMDRKR